MEGINLTDKSGAGGGGKLHLAENVIPTSLRTVILHVAVGGSKSLRWYKIFRSGK